MLYNAFVTLSAFKAWVENSPELKEQKGEEVFLQVYSLGNKSKFADYKYSLLQNTPATVYYDWSDILKNTQKIEGK